MKTKKYPCVTHVFYDTNHQNKIEILYHGLVQGENVELSDYHEVDLAELFHYLLSIMNDDPKIKDVFDWVLSNKLIYHFTLDKAWVCAIHNVEAEEIIVDKHGISHEVYRYLLHSSCKDIDSFTLNVLAPSFNFECGKSLYILISIMKFVCEKLHNENKKDLAQMLYFDMAEKIEFIEPKNPEDTDFKFFLKAYFQYRMFSKNILTETKSSYVILKNTWKLLSQSSIWVDNLEDDLIGLLVHCAIAIETDPFGTERKMWAKTGLLACKKDVKHFEAISLSIKLKILAMKMVVDFSNTNDISTPETNLSEIIKLQDGYLKFLLETGQKDLAHREAIDFVNQFSQIQHKFKIHDETLELMVKSRPLEIKLNYLIDLINAEKPELALQMLISTVYMGQNYQHYALDILMLVPHVKNRELFSQHSYLLSAYYVVLFSLIFLIKDMGKKEQSKKKKFVQHYFSEIEAANLYEFLIKEKYNHSYYMSTVKNRNRIKLLEKMVDDAFDCLETRQTVMKTIASKKPLIVETISQPVVSKQKIIIPPEVHIREILENFVKNKTLIFEFLIDEQKASITLIARDEESKKAIRNFHKSFTPIFKDKYYKPVYTEIKNESKWTVSIVVTQFKSVEMIFKNNIAWQRVNALNTPVLQPKTEVKLLSEAVKKSLEAQIESLSFGGLFSVIDLKTDIHFTIQWETTSQGLRLQHNQEFYTVQSDWIKNTENFIKSYYKMEKQDTDGLYLFKPILSSAATSKNWKQLKTRIVNAMNHKSNVVSIPQPGPQKEKPKPILPTSEPEKSEIVSKLVMITTVFQTIFFQGCETKKYHWLSEGKSKSKNRAVFIIDVKQSPVIHIRDDFRISLVELMNKLVNEINDKESCDFRSERFFIIKNAKLTAIYAELHNGELQRKFRSWFDSLQVKQSVQVNIDSTNDFNSVLSGLLTYPDDDPALDELVNASQPTLHPERSRYGFYQEDETTEAINMDSFCKSNNF